MTNSLNKEFEIGEEKNKKLTNRQEDEIVIFGETNFRNINKRFGIKKNDRRRHFYIIGKTGGGKSTMIENMIYQDIRAGRAVGVIDPHGELAEKVINFIPPERINETIYFNPADIDHPIAFNILEKVNPNLRHLVASGLIGIFKKIWADSWGPRLEYVLRNAVLALLEYPGSTLLGIMRILVDKEYRKKVINKVSDPVVRSFWTEEFVKYSGSFQTEAIAPIQNKVGQFLSTALIRNIVGQVRSSFSLREIMDKNMILVMNLSKGRIGEDASALLGAMMITKIQLAAMSRIDMAEEERKDFYLYVDEFQNFATDSFVNILSEARKYRLNLILAHQYVEQLDEKVAAAVFGNVGTLTAFRVGAIDAEALAKEFMPRFDEMDLVNLDNYEIYVKLMIDGITSEAFSAVTLPPLAQLAGVADKIIKVSRERYTEDRRIVEEKISRWAGIPEEEIQKKSSKEGIKKYEAECSLCGGITHLTFVPDKIRPIYCKKCLKVSKKQKDQNNNLKLKTEQKINIKQDGFKKEEKKDALIEKLIIDEKK
ncbi:MAG: type IV secretion system DNA-binding domain-containing protein [Bacteroidetes bacterium]|nr:type IV secretion system DNA-binding domain-containing protein [Bacteroidota bacterium]